MSLSTLSCEAMIEISKLYPQWFIFEARWHCDEFLRSKLNINDPQTFQQDRVAFFQGLLTDLNQKVQAAADPTTKLRLIPMIEHLRAIDPETVFRSLLESMTNESEYLRKITAMQTIEIFENFLNALEREQLDLENQTCQGMLNNQNVADSTKNFVSKLHECIQVAEKSVSDFTRKPTNERRAEEFKKLEEVLIRFSRFFTKIPFNFGNFPNEIMNSWEDVLLKLLRSDLVVEKQPPQVLKTTAKFEANVCLLFSFIFGTNLAPSVKVKLISENVAASIFKDKKNETKEIQSFCKISKESCNMTYDSNTNRYIAELKDLRLEGFKRSGRKSNDNVTDEKFAFLFETSINVAGKSRSIYTISDPVVIIVHGSQETQAHATIYWDNCFKKADRVPFEVPVSVPWEQFASALNKKFEIELGRGLTPENLNYLGEKILNKIGIAPISPDTQITWNSFCKETLSKSKYTFLEWFEQTFKLIKDHLGNHWKTGLIHGFISKAAAENMLQNSSQGTFLLRFSDSEAGSVSVSWIDYSYQILHIQPFNSGDLKTRKLAERLNDLEKLEFLYPNIPKSDAFKIENLPSQAIDHITLKVPYVPTILKVVINDQFSSGIASPNTFSPPQIFPQHPQYIQQPMDQGSMHFIPVHSVLSPASSQEQYSPESQTDYNMIELGGFNNTFSTFATYSNSNGEN